MAFDSESSLEAVQAALQQGDYSNAIALLEAICLSNIDDSEQVERQIELLAKTDPSELNRAIALCQLLSQSSDSQLQKWALLQAELANLHSQESVTVVGLTGFVPFERQDSLGIQSQGGDKGDKGDLEDLGDKGDLEDLEDLGEKMPPCPSAPLPLCPSALNWRQAGRAQRWAALPSVNLIPFWLLQCGSAIALFWVIRALLDGVMAFTNDLLVKLPYLEPFQPFYRDQTHWIALTLLLLLCLLPWFLDALLRLVYSLQPLPLDTLSNHSPEASRLLQRYCRQRKLPLPQLGVLPTVAPIALTYGNLPYTVRIVVSQGLLNQLADDEIAAIYSMQLGHIAHWDFIVMSLFICVTQIPYLVYLWVSQWGDQRTNETLRVLVAVLANSAYGLWLLLSIPALGLSQLRIYYSDRFAAEMTGNPNGLTRALLKIAQGVAQDIQQQGYTSRLLESWNLLTVVSYHQAIALSSLHSCTQFEAALAWDCLNPRRYWLNLNSTHPLIGDRLQRLNRLARLWNLELEVKLPKGQGGQGGQGRSLSIPYHLPPTTYHLPSTTYPLPPTTYHLPLTPFLLQVAPYLGILLGFIFGSLTWVIGGVGMALGISQLAWMYGDWWLVLGCIPIGVSIGILMRINASFPDLNATILTNPSLPDLLANSDLLPVPSLPLRLQGKLIGRRGISNWLGQDLMLQLPVGLVKLHYVSWFGPVGDLLFRPSPSPTELIGRHLFATGWFRRGATAWIDVDILQTQGGKVSRSGHPVWSTLLAIAATALGVYILLTGGT